jgi:hypothetical protein
VIAPLRHARGQRPGGHQGSADATHTIQAALVRFPDLTVHRASQTYTRLDEFTYRYASGTFESELVVHDDGLVIQYVAWLRTAEATGPEDSEPLDARR